MVAESPPKGVLAQPYKWVKNKLCVEMTEMQKKWTERSCTRKLNMSLMEVHLWLFGGFRVFSDSLEWVGVGHWEHPREVVAVYSFHVIYQNALTRTTERKIPTCVDETRTINEHSDRSKTCAKNLNTARRFREQVRLSSYPGTRPAVSLFWLSNRSPGDFHFPSHGSYTKTTVSGTVQKWWDPSVMLSSQVVPFP